MKTPDEVSHPNVEIDRDLEAEWNPALGRIVGGAAGYSSPQQSMMVMSDALRQDRSTRDVGMKGVHQVSIRDLQWCLGEMERIVSDLKYVAYLHPSHGVAQYAQLTLADVAGLILRSWPADASKSVQPTFQNLYVMEGGTFRNRWDREHKTGRRTHGDRKHDFLHALLFFRVWPRYQTSAYNVIEDLSGRRSVDFARWPHEGYHDLNFVSSLQAFYRAIPGLVREFQDMPVEAHGVAWRSLLTHFDLFWDTVMDPAIFKGNPSVWQEWTQNAFNGSKAPSKHRPQLKRLLLRMLRSSIPDIIVKTSVDG